jgi:small subunit ribosomal protein S16
VAVLVRLSRHGTRNAPFYHVVAQDRRDRRDGRFIEKLGTYDPAPEQSLIELKEDRIQFWYARGAQLSPTVAKLAKIKNLKLERAQAKPRKASAKK